MARAAEPDLTRAIGRADLTSAIRPADLIHVIGGPVGIGGKRVAAA